jgi:membrane fusion protein (multidrug efflux system)
MKKISLILLIVITASCGEANKSVESIVESGNLSEIKAKKDEVTGKQQEINEQLKLLSDAISKLDTLKRVPLITTFKAETEVFNHYLELQGNVMTKQNVLVYPEMSGLLSSVYVKEGQYVSKGQLLAKIDEGGLGQQLAQLQIQANLAKTTFERQERLWNQKIGSEIEYLQSKSNYEGQQKVVAQTQSQLAKTEIRAPFSGIIDDVITEQGTVVGAGQSEILRIVNLNDMYIETDVPENYLPYITKNKKVIVEFPILGKTVEAFIRQAGNFINPANRTFKVEIAVPNKDKSIKPNLTARLKINDYTNEKTFLIPQSIISENAEGQQYVFVVTDKKNKNEGKAKKVIIKTGKTQGDFIEVLQGFEEGAEIIKEGARSVQDGQIVEIINQ